MDLMVTDESPSAISDKIKEILYAKTAERVDSIRPIASSSLFGEDEQEYEDDEDDEIEVDEYEIEEE